MRIALLLLAACAHAAASGPVQPGKLIVFGEVHGSNEIPRFFGDLVDDAARRGMPVHVGLELSGRDGPVWTASFQSGRTSEAMAQLIERLDAMKVPIFWFDSEGPDRDGAMATNISAERRKAPGDLYLVLVGNLHARKKPGAPWDPNVRWMAVRLAESEPEVITLDVRYRAGTAWICQSNSPEACKPTTLQGSPAPTAAGVALAPQPEGYDGTFDVGTLTASLPARSGR
jgi:hypothetical protein